MSKSAELMAKHIQDEIISKCPPDPVTLHISSVNLKLIPTQFLKGLDSRTTLLLRILENLNDDHVDAVGLFGMGGTGKTSLAKEVIARVKGAFAIKVMVEVSHAPDFVRIQAAIAESIDLLLHNVDDVGQRAIRLYNRLIEVEKEKKVLIILDNVWHKLNLDEVGIPRTCKLLLTTRDKEVCRLMDVEDGNIFEVGVMRTNEARELFKSQIGNQADLLEYKNVVERLLSKCGGLPLAIVATANSLKDKKLSSWENFADDLEKPISSQYSGDYRQAFSILGTSYKSIQGEEKRIFFFTCLFIPVGSSVSIETLMRYGMGLNLFEHVSKLSEAVKRAVTWADELTLSSMLLEGDIKGDVKIHDIVRDFAISCAARDEEHKFMVEGIPRWLDDDTLIKYTAMSLTSKNDYSRLSGVEVVSFKF
ncbi:disease resistance protein SUMM2-like [Silene latifolia]|uniref:disease resistance protein SUMM2-like n=1 Tax=Silene latifolia TaxID=37657 RepID=UPI003D781B0F